MTSPMTKTTVCSSLIEEGEAHVLRNKSITWASH